MRIKKLSILLVGVVVLIFILSSFLQAQVRVASTSTKDISKLEFPVNKPVPKKLLKYISIELKNVPLGKALREISQRGNFELLFSETFVPVGRIVSVSLDNATVVEALQEVLFQTATDYAVTSSGQIVLVPTKYTKSNSNLLQEVPQKQIQGIVVDETTGEPLVGANVFIKGETIGTAADFDGRFSFGYNSDNEFTLVTSYIGFKTFEKVYSPSDDLSNLRIALLPDPFLTEEIVVTGIASRRAKSVAEVAVSRISAENLTAKQLYTNLDQLVAGKIAGVQMHAASGNVGGGYRFFVRGGGGLNGDGQPLIYIDGIRVDDSRIAMIWNGGQGFSNLLSLVPNEIEEIEVLKGPAAAAMYGTNASNGVVLITTKSGKAKKVVSGDVSINYKLSYGYNTKPFSYDPDTYFNADLYNNEILRNGAIRNHTVDIAGGTGILRYYASYENKFEEGLAPKNHQTRNAARINVTALPSDKWNIKANAAFSINDISRPFSDDAILSPHWNTLMIDAPWKWYDSTAIAATQNPAENNRFMGSGQVNWSPLKNLEFFGSIGVDYNNHREDEFLPPGYGYWLGTGGRRVIAQRSNTQYTYDLKVSYTYKPLRDLEVTSVAGSQLFNRQVTTTWLQRRQYATELISEIGTGSDIRNLEETKFQERQAGLYTTHTLSYMAQYFATLGLRKDYASAIGQNAPSIYYPSASFALRVDRYNFLPDFMNLLKLRVAYGESGQLPSARDSKRLLWGAFGNAYGPGAIPDFAGNPAIEPERIKEIEFGFDAEFFGKYSLEMTYFKQNATNSIVAKPNSPSTGFGNLERPFNVGKAEGHGIELLFQANPIRTRNYGLDFSFIWNWQENEIKDLDGQGPLIANYRVNAIEEGMPKHQYYAVITTGAKFDENGVYIGDIESDGRVDLGSPIPNHTGSSTINFRFLKNFNLYALADWGLNKKVFSIFRQFAARNGGYKPFFEMAARLGVDRWSWNSNIDFDDYEKLTPGTPEYTALANEFAQMNPFYRGNYIYDADYFVIRELSLSYNFTDLVSRSGLLASRIKGITVGFAIKNLLRTSKYKDGDFEVNAPGSRSSAWGIDYGTVPPPRVFNFWFNVSI